MSTRVWTRQAGVPAPRSLLFRRVFVAAAFILCAQSLQAGLQSLVLDGTNQFLKVDLPASTSFTQVGSFRYEFELYNFRVNYPQVQRLMWSPHFTVRIEPSSTLLRFFDLSTASTAHVEVDLAGRTDVMIRLQRDLANSRLSAEIWNIDGTGYRQTTVATPLTAVNESGDIGLTIGSAHWAALEMLQANLASFKWFSTVVPLGSGRLTANADLIDCTFEGNLADTSREKLSVKPGRTPVYARNPAANPVVIIESNETARAGITMVLDGSPSWDPRGTIVGYSWKQAAGPSEIPLSRTQLPQTPVTLTEPGSYTFELTVTDDRNNSASGSISFSIISTGPGDLVKIEDPAVASIIGPILLHRSSFNPWPWFDSAAMDNGDRNGTAFPVNPPGDMAGRGTVSVTEGSVNVTGLNTSFITDAASLAKAGFLVVHYRLPNRLTGRRAYPIGSVSDPTHLTLADWGSYDLPSDSGISYGLATQDEADNFIEGLNYYDEILVQYRNFHRTGQIRFRDYARKIADCVWRYWTIDEGRRIGQGNIAPRDAPVAGLILRALDGRPEMWPWIEQYVEIEFDTWVGQRLDYPGLYYGARESGMVTTYAAELAAADPDEATRKKFFDLAHSAAVRYFARLQYPDGSWRWEDSAWKGYAEQPFHVGLLLEGMIAVHKLTQDPIVLTSIIAGIDHLSQIYRSAPARGQWYNIYDTLCPSGCGSASDSPTNIHDIRALNNTIIHAYGYAYRQTGDANYLRHGDELFSSTFGHGQGPGSDQYWGEAETTPKQYNQSFRSTASYLADRVATPVNASPVLP